MFRVEEMNEYVRKGSRIPDSMQAAQHRVDELEQQYRHAVCYLQVHSFRYSRSYAHSWRRHCAVICSVRAYYHQLSDATWTIEQVHSMHEFRRRSRQYCGWLFYALFSLIMRMSFYLYNGSLISTSLLYEKMPTVHEVGKQVCIFRERHNG